MVEMDLKDPLCLHRAPSFPIGIVTMKMRTMTTTMMTMMTMMSIMMSIMVKK